MDINEPSGTAVTDPPPNETLKLASTLLLSYLFSAGYRYYMRRHTPGFQHVYFVLSGLSLMYFNYGFDTYHSLGSVFLIYLILRLFSGTILSVLLAFIFLMGHLLVGYAHANNEYDLSWVVPQCVLTLRLIGLVWDVYDGQHSKHDKHKHTALHDTPGLLEIAAYTYFFGSFLVGPQYPLRRLRSMVNGDFNDPDTGFPRNNLSPCLQRLALGLLYAIAYFSLYSKLPTEFFLSSTFKAESMLWKSIHLCLWFRFILFRYFACWLVTEGSCILAGLAYNGKNTESGADMWDGVRNIRLTSFELGCTFQSIIDSFNYNTNQWAARYIFKRLQFLGNKSLSHLLTLAFLALWHGLYSGYFICFFFEFVCIVAERQANTILHHLPRVRKLLDTDGIIFHPVWLLKKVLVTYGCAYGLLPFALLRFSRWWKVYTDLKFSGFFLYGIAWQTFFALASYVLSKKRNHQ